VSVSVGTRKRKWDAETSRQAKEAEGSQIPGTHDEESTSARCRQPLSKIVCDRYLTIELVDYPLSLLYERSIDDSLPPLENEITVRQLCWRLCKPPTLVRRCDKRGKRSMTSLFY
jgi:hypothetical protein